MRGAGSAARGLAPALLLALFAFWAGTVAGGATAWGAIGGQALLALAAVAVGWRRGTRERHCAAAEEAGLATAGGTVAGWDPLGLGWRGRLLPVAVWVAAAASLMASPVPRAGRVGLVLLPAFFILPRLVARAWAVRAARRWGLRAVAAVVAVGAGWSLLSRPVFGAPRAADPIGHHGLAAVWLLALLPLAVLPVRERGGWRALGLGAGTAALAALVAGGSLAGQVGLAVEAGLLVLWTVRGGGRWRRGGRREETPRPAPAALRSETSRAAWTTVAAALAAVALAIAGLAVLHGPRIAEVLAGTDTSARARWVYSQGGWRGFVDRPLLGWGPGATAWTLAAFLRPVPGVNPPGEVVAEPHSLPLRLLYELGATGALLVLALVALFVCRRVRGLAGGRDPVLARAGLAGLAGAGIALMATAWLEVTALPVALAVAAGAALAGAVPRDQEAAGTETGRFKGGWTAAAAGTGAGRCKETWSARVVALGYALVAAVVLVPLGRAQLAYDAAVAEAAAGPGGGDPRPALGRAVRLDPAFPLYRAWWAWSLGPAAVAREARRAAEDGWGVAPLWLVAGVYGGDAGEGWTAAALDRACTLDPLGAMAPYYRAAFDPSAPRAAVFAARALLAAPPLAAATFWEGREQLLTRAVEEAERWPGVDPVWRRSFADAVHGWNPQVPGTVDRLALRVDPDGRSSLALRAFRRRPRAFRLVEVEVRRELAAQLRLPAAATLPTTSPAAFAGPGCGRPSTAENPQTLWKTLRETGG